MKYEGAFLSQQAWEEKCPRVVSMKACVPGLEASDHPSSEPKLPWQRTIDGDRRIEKARIVCLCHESRSSSFPFNS
jgi:hypothetical protein